MAGGVSGAAVAIVSALHDELAARSGSAGWAAPPTIRGALGTANPAAELTDELRALREAMLRAVMRTSADAAQRDPAAWLGPRLDALADSLRTSAAHVAAQASRGGAATGNGIDTQQLLAQIRRIEQSLVPVVGAAVEQRAGDTLLANKMVPIIELLEQLDARLSTR